MKSREIKDLIPQRDPIMMVDKLIQASKGKANQTDAENKV